ncbi:Eukaryotic translation initiation factor 3 subunit [Vigna angularis]|uniref:Eukaryotic translation initiation factor 3 subunit n=1 Tax=Phaseolus angularis TaxID=3914 RepID=A0A8T0JWQ9_PHAAN|nr:Eukaryotic translation initiation factor 3 subunit [Vigna angularis]
MVDVMVMKEIEDTTLLLGVDSSILDLDSICLPPSETCRIVSDDEEVYEEDNLEFESGFGNIIIFDNFPIIRLTLSSIGEYKKAEDAHLKSLQIDRNFLEAWAHLTQFYQDISKPTKAQECLSQMLQIDGSGTPIGGSFKAFCNVIDSDSVRVELLHDPILSQFSNAKMSMEDFNCRIHARVSEKNGTVTSKTTATLPPILALLNLPLIEKIDKQGNGSARVQGDSIERKREKMEYAVAPHPGIGSVPKAMEGEQVAAGKAINDLSIGLSVDGPNVECLYLRASCYHALEQYKEVVNDYDAALDLELDSMDKFMLQCLAFYQVGAIAFVALTRLLVLEQLQVAALTTIDMVIASCPITFHTMGN